MILSIKKILEKYSTFLKYIISAGFSFVIDLVLFTLFLAVIKPLLGDVSIFVATIGARVISSFFNYLVNRNAVFKHNNEQEKTDLNTLIRYYILVIIQMFVSSGLVFGIHKILPINETIIKIPVDVFIFMVNYFVQKLYIFKK